MDQNNQEIYSYQNDEIDLRKLFNSLVEKKLFIFSVTALVTLLAIIYVKTISPIYNATSEFSLPNESSILSINRLELINESKESVFADFLNLLSSQDIQRKVFDDGGYLTALNPENEPINDVEEFTASFLKSIELQAPITAISTKEKVGGLIEQPYSISIEGSDNKIISRFLNELVDLANHENISSIKSLINQKIDIRLDEISLERNQLLGLAERDRLSTIERIKEVDAHKIRVINDQIDRARYKTKEDRLNQIVALTDAAKLAGSLGIIENNLEKITKSVESDFNLNIAINEVEDLPEWYLYGEKALLERVKLLENRTSDDPYIPELVTLTNQLKEVQNNNLLKTLEERQDDSPFIAEITKLDFESTILDSAIIDMTGISSMTVLKEGYISPISQKKRLIVLLAFLGAFMMSIFLTLIMGALRPDEQAD